jgi:hypothetical protein
MLRVVRDEFFPFLHNEIQQRSAFGKFLKDTNCLIHSGIAEEPRQVLRSQEPER